MQIERVLAGHVGQPAVHRRQAAVRVLVRLPLQQGRARRLHADRLHEEGRPRHLSRATVGRRGAAARRSSHQPAVDDGGLAAAHAERRSSQAALDALGPAHKSWLLSAPLPAAGAAARPRSTARRCRRRCRCRSPGSRRRRSAELEKMFGDSNVVPVRAGGATGARRPKRARPKFVMGGAIAVELIRGDMSRGGDRHGVVRRRRQGARVRPPDVPDRRDLRAGRRPRASTRSSRRRRARS